MNVIVLDPHGDDAVLFACYALVAFRPHVIVTHPTVPRDEITAAMRLLDCPFTIADSRSSLRMNLAIAVTPDLVFAPAEHPEGHAAHNEAARFAVDFFGQSKVKSYLTYGPRGQRSREGTEFIPTIGGIALKLRALACFESQIEQPSTRPWFFDLLDLREWVL